MPTGAQQMSEANCRLSGDDLQAMFSAAARLVELNVDSINALNVFPVPDGDTGTNMYLTLRDVVEQTGSLSGASAGDVTGAMAHAAMMGARGNSGVILSQFFRGMAVALEGDIGVGCKELVKVFQQARDYSYDAVGKPVEGTMLTVLSSAAKAAQEAADLGGHSGEILEAVSVAARDCVALTPTMLPVLREAGVVDAGGQGLAVMFEAMRRAATGEHQATSEILPPAPIGVEGEGQSVSLDFVDAVEELEYGYCTQFVVQGDSLDPEVVRETMKLMSSSTVIVGDESAVRVHVHAEDPGRVLSAAVSVGALSCVSIQNMDEQRAVFSQEMRDKNISEPVGVAVVAVAGGDGFKDLFISLGAADVIQGGDTMNPSVRDLLQAVERSPSDNVVILPNNNNIVPAAVQAATNSMKNVKALPTRSIPQGVAAMLSFNTGKDFDANVSDMEGSIASVQSGAVTKAVRTATIDGVTVGENQFIGMLENKIISAGQDLTGLVDAVLREAGASSESLVTLYWGSPVNEEDANRVAQDIERDDLKGIEIELVRGGQPHYHFIISVE